MHANFFRGAADWFQRAGGGWRVNYLWFGFHNLFWWNNFQSNGDSCYPSIIELFLNNLFFAKKESLRYKEVNLFCSPMTRGEFFSPPAPLCFERSLHRAAERLRMAVNWKQRQKGSGPSHKMIAKPGETRENPHCNKSNLDCTLAIPTKKIHHNNNKQQTTNNKQQTTNNNQQPTTNNQQPTTNNQQTTTNNQQPTTNNQQPTTNNQQPTTNNQQPTTNNQQPTTNNQQPTTNNQQPTTNNQQPTTNNQQPTTNNQQPTTNNQQPTTNNQQPTTNNQQPTTNNKTKKQLKLSSVSIAHPCLTFSQVNRRQLCIYHVFPDHIGQLVRAHGRHLHGVFVPVFLFECFLLGGGLSKMFGKRPAENVRPFEDFKGPPP